MAALGRLTDVLRVVEANYYHRLRTLELPAAEKSGATSFVHLQKVVARGDADEDLRGFSEWFARAIEPELSTIAGLRRVGVYRLYRIMEELAVPPEEIPHVLVVCELHAASADEALAKIARAFGAWSRVSTDSYAIRDAILYRSMSEVRSGTSDSEAP